MNIKLVIGILVVVIIWLLYSSKQEQQVLNQSMVNLTTLVEQKETVIINKQEAVIEAAEEQNELLLQQIQASEKQSELLAKKLQESEQQSKVTKAQMANLSGVIDGFQETQSAEKALREANQAMSQQALYASRRVSGIKIATTIKQRVGEHYMNEGKFPHTNRSLGLRRSNGYANQDVHSITVSRGGKITVVFTATSGVDKGAISLTPKPKLGRIEWQCSTRDYPNIHRTMPGCQLL